ncbi:MAG: nitronate monooxygenase [Halioglobus sp.]
MKLEDHLHIKLPIIQAPMAGVQNSTLTIAVSNAGGLGSLACAMLGMEKLEQELETIKRHTDKPYNLNFFCHESPAPDAERESTWRKTLTPYYQELGIDPDCISEGPSRAPFDEEIVDLIAPYAPPFVSFHFGLPKPELLERVKLWGAKVLSSATTVDEARWLEANGADIIIAQGLEAGGHRGMFLTEDVTTQVGTLGLVSQVLDAVNLPVVAAGGIADAIGVAAVLRLGAIAAQVGTSYLLCPEVTTTALHRAAIQGPRAQHTALTNLLTGRPARSVVNRIMQELGPISSAPPAFPLAVAALSLLRAEAESEGRDDFTPLWCGQNAKGCKEIPAAELTRMLALEVGALTQREYC